MADDEFVEQLTERSKKAEETSAGYGETINTLTDRLNQFDQYRGEAEQRLASPAPKGYDPTKSLAAWFGMTSGRKALESDIERSRTGQRGAEQDITDILLAIQEYKKESDPTSLTTKDKLSAEISALAQDHKIKVLARGK